MSRYRYSKFRYRLKSFFLPIFLIICLVVAIFGFHKFFIVQPQQKSEHIKQLIAEEKYPEAADLLYDFSYKEYSNKEFLQQICEGRPELVLYTLDVGDTFFFGKYEQDNKSKNGPEPIEWRVLDKDGRKLLIQTTKVIEEKAYYESYSKKNYGTRLEWNETALYSFLNNDFLEEAFSEIEKKMISFERIGKIFILNSKQCGSYYKLSPRVAEPTNYVRHNYNPDIKEDGFVSVWLRSDSKDYVYSVRCDYNRDGGEHWKTEKDYTAYATSVNGIRPAMWITVSSLTDQNSLEGENQ